MKIFKFSIIIFAIGLLSLSSCTKEDLDKFPDGQVRPELSLSNIDDIKYWSNGFYTYLRSRIYGVYNYTDIQADFVIAASNYGNNQGGVHRWDFTSDDYTIRDVWANMYSAIANINYFLANADVVKAEGDSEIATMNRAKAEAHFARAYYYHRLVLHYAKDYEPSTASSDLGVPLVDEIDITAKPARATVQQTYDFILNDLSKAKSLMPTSAVTKYRIGHDAIDALRARVALDMHNYQEAVTITDALLAKYAYVTSSADLKSMWKNDANTSEVIFRISAKKNVENPTTNSIYFVSSTWYSGAGGLAYFAPYYYPTLRALQLYESGDWRFNSYFSAQYCNQGGSLRQAYVVEKYIGNPSLYIDSRLPNYRHMQLVFRSSEMGMINAEANYRLGNEVAALTAVNDLRVARGVAEIDESGADLFEAIKVERTRELMYEGTRIFDLKRWNDPMPQRGLGHTAYTQTGANFNLLSKPAGDDKFVWAIPRNDETINKNIIQNPGW